MSKKHHSNRQKRGKDGKFIAMGGRGKKRERTA